MKPDKFARIAESLRQYRRADLREFQKELGDNPVDALYVDPLPGDAVLQSIVSSNTTFLLGRKGTGKSTIFAKAQAAYRGSREILSVYIDVKSLYELLSPQEISSVDSCEGIDVGICRSHMLRKSFLGTVISELLIEIEKTCNNMSFFDVFRGGKRSYDKLRHNLIALATEVKHAKLEQHEIPILQKMSRQWRTQIKKESSEVSKAEVGVEMSCVGPKAKASATVSDFDKTLDDSEVYKEYSEIILQAYPFSRLLDQIKDLLADAKMSRLVVFFDDFSELNFVDQKLFVDVVLTPLNNSSNETVKLKIAGYPGRVYYGKIDPTKVDTIVIDFASLYEASDVQGMEASAIDYTTRLLETRFRAFGEDITDYFDASTPMVEHMRLMFQASFNVPRLMGVLLHTCYLDRISKGYTITPAAIRLSAKKYYESTISQYFDRMNRYALEPFENKLDRHNQKELLGHIIAEARDVRKKIRGGTLGGTYFKDLSNPPTSHFIVQPSLESLFRSLESNFLLSRYKDTRDKNGQPVIVYALYYGIIEVERMSWGYPPGSTYRNYFVQRCFDYSRTIQVFLSSKKTIRCDHCGTCFPLEKQESFAMYSWQCPDCREGTCHVEVLAEEFQKQYEQLQNEIMLEAVELDILNILCDEASSMRAGEISGLLDVTYQLIGRRTGKLQEMGLVDKERNPVDNHMRSSITDLAVATYFS